MSTERSDPSPSQPSILLVDDEADVLETLASLLELSMPYVKVRTAVSGEQGLRLLAEGPADVIIADYRMPGMDGLEFLKRTQETCPNASRAILTAFPKLELAIQAINEVTIDRFLVKPVKGDQLIAIVKSLLIKAEGRGASSSPGYVPRPTVARGGT